jgi:uncharacterized protein YndB with AHSA1/START domain
MATGSGRVRNICVSRIIKAPRRTVYAACVDARAVASWLPPATMKAEVRAFDPRAGGAYWLSLTYLEPKDRPRGKTSEATDTFRGRFVTLVACERIVQVGEFESNDPAYAGAMTVSWTFADVPGGTEVTVRCENVPEGIRPDDHEAGLRSTLKNLAAFTE